MSVRVRDGNEAAAVAEKAVGERVAAEWPEGSGLRGFIATVDHKRIGRRYIATAGLFFALAGLEAVVMRTQLAHADESLLTPELYNQLFTLHGTVMIFFFATPMLFGFGNFLFPLMLGTRDMAFPRLNAFGYWVFAAAGLIMFGSLALGHAPDAGWFNYVPLSTNRYSPAVNIDVYSLGLLFLGISTTIGAINFPA
jgi:cytochrome c oxidase subunit I+III